MYALNQRTVASLLGVSPSSVITLRKMNYLQSPEDKPKKITQDSVDELLRRKEISLPSYSSLLLARKSPADQFTTSSLYFDPASQTEYIEEALQEFAIRYKDDPSVDVEDVIKKVHSGEYAVTGYWVCPERYLPLLTDGGVIAGTTLGWISEAAEVIAHAQTVPDGQDKVFIVRPFRGDEMKPWLCYQDIMSPRVKSEFFVADAEQFKISDEIQRELFMQAERHKADKSVYPAIIIGKSGKPEVFIFRTP